MNKLKAYTHVADELDAETGKYALFAYDVDGNRTPVDETEHVYLKSDADKVIAELDESHKKEVAQLLLETAELKDRCQKHDFFWEGCGFSKMGFKNTIDVANYVEELKTKVDLLQHENQILKQYRLMAHSSYGIGTKSKETK